MMPSSPAAKVQISQPSDPLQPKYSQLTSQVLTRRGLSSSKARDKKQRTGDDINKTEV